MLLYNSIRGVGSLSQGFQAKKKWNSTGWFCPPPPALPLYRGRDSWHILTTNRRGARSIKDTFDIFDKYGHRHCWHCSFYMSFALRGLRCAVVFDCALIFPKCVPMVVPEPAVMPLAICEISSPGQHREIRWALSSSASAFCASSCLFVSVLGPSRRSLEEAIADYSSYLHVDGRRSTFVLVRGVGVGHGGETTGAAGRINWHCAIASNCETRRDNKWWQCELTNINNMNHYE